MFPSFFFGDLRGKASRPTSGVDALAHHRAEPQGPGAPNDVERERERARARGAWRVAEDIEAASKKLLELAKRMARRDLGPMENRGWTMKYPRSPTKTHDTMGYHQVCPGGHEKFNGGSGKLTFSIFLLV